MGNMELRVPTFTSAGRVSAARHVSPPTLSQRMMSSGGGLLGVHRNVDSVCVDFLEGRLRL